MQIRPYDNLEVPSDPAEIKKMLSKLVVVKLNGGLGTSMGCKGPKSVIPLRNDQTFLDLTVQQIESLNKQYDTDVPLVRRLLDQTMPSPVTMFRICFQVLMNSFNTDEDTDKVIRKYTGFKVRILTFNQSRYPRINRETLLPIAKDVRTERDLEA